jgi:hypothetical protein
VFLTGLAVLLAADAAVGTGVLQRAVRASQDHVVAIVVPHIPAPTPVEVRTGRGGLPGAFASVNNGLLARPQSDVPNLSTCPALSRTVHPEMECETSSPFLITTYSALRLVLLPRSEPWGVEIHLVDVDSGGGLPGLVPRLGSRQPRDRRSEGRECAFRTPEFGDSSVGTRRNWQDR